MDKQKKKIDRRVKQGPRITGILVVAVIVGIVAATAKENKGQTKWKLLSDSRPEPIKPRWSLIPPN